MKRSKSPGEHDRLRIVPRPTGAPKGPRVGRRVLSRRDFLARGATGLGALGALGWAACTPTDAGPGEGDGDVPPPDAEDPRPDADGLAPDANPPPPEADAPAGPWITPEERIRRLRDAILAEKPTPRLWLPLAWNREILPRYAGLPRNLQMAHYFSDLIDRMSPTIGDEELIVGSLLSLYPAVEPDADTLLLHLTELIHMLRPSAGPPDRDAAEEVIDHICAEHADELASFGLTCEQLREAAAGEIPALDDVAPANHYAPDFERVLERGLGGLLEDVRVAAAAAGPEGRDFYDGLSLALQAGQRFVLSYADEAARLAAEAPPGRREELEGIARVCRNVATNPPATFHEALQLTWFVHVLAQLTGAVAVSAGRPDRYLERFRAADGIGDEQAVELLACFLAKHNHVGSRQVLSVTVGGLTPDGRDATNDTTRLVLRATRLARMPYPNVTARLHDAVPEWYVGEIVETIQEGTGLPSVFNDETIVPGLVAAGVREEHARDYHVMGCNEVMIPGRSQSYAAPTLVLPTFGLGLADPLPRSFEEFRDRYYSWLRDAVGSLGFGIGTDPDPFASAVTGKCIERGRHLDDGGAEYRIFGVWGIGLGTAADSLAAIRKLVFEDRVIAADELIAALRADFAGYEALRLRLVNEAPKFGNDDPYVDEIAADLARVFGEAVLGRSTPGGRTVLPMLASFKMHVHNGAGVGATPDGRRPGAPLSDGCSPSQGKDVDGATAMMQSVAGLPFALSPGGSALNLKLMPDLVAGPAGATTLAGLLRAFFDMGDGRRGGQVQVNVVTDADLRDARDHPDEHADLIVRVAGFCEYFVTLEEALQNEIISRTEQTET